MVATLVCLAGIFQAASSPKPQIWERRPAPGIAYRMEVEAEPMRVIHALRFDRTATQYWATASQANDEVYDLRPTNGRATLSQMVRDAGAIGGVNGDFFQWGDDPGGDPVGLMVRNGELISHPGGTGARVAALGWGGGETRIAVRSVWTASVRIGDSTWPLRGLNEYARPDALTLATPAAGYAVSKGPAIFLFLKTPAAVLRPRGEVKGVVVGMAEGKEKVPVPPGTMILMARGTAAGPVRRISLGQAVTIRSDVSGFDFDRIDNVLGGGPVLVRNGAVARSAAADPRNPRTAVGTDRNGNVWYVIVEGRQPMSVGASLKEMAEVMLRLGCEQAVNLDGGGSSSMILFGTTLNRPSGGVERAIANAILWHGPTPTAPAGELAVEGPAQVAMGGTASFRVLRGGSPVPNEGVVWTCQGAAWIDQDGLLRPIKAGPATVRALTEGATIEWKVTVTE